MLRSLEGGIGSPSLLMGLSPETGKERSCLEQQHDCTWVGCCCCCYRKGECDGAGSASGRDSHPVSAAMSHITDRRGSVCSPLSYSVWCHSSFLHPYPWQGCLSSVVGFRRQNSILLTLLRSLSQLWLPERLQIFYNSACRGAELESLFSFPIKTALLCVEYLERETFYSLVVTEFTWERKMEDPFVVQKRLFSGQRKQENKEGKRR